MAELQEDSFQTVAGFMRTELKIKASRFIASILPVMNEVAAHEFIDKISSEFRDATHNCYAYRLGTGSNVRYRYSDAGEPSGTAGVSILGAIESSGITNAAIVVTRFFGGTKLGIGPLRRAYRDSALSAIRSSLIETRYQTTRYSFSVPFAVVKEMKNLLKSMNAEIFSEEYLGEARFIVDVRNSRVGDFETRFRDITRGKIPRPLAERKINI